MQQRSSPAAASSQPAAREDLPQKGAMRSVQGVVGEEAPGFCLYPVYLIGTRAQLAAAAWPGPLVSILWFFNLFSWSLGLLVSWSLGPLVPWSGSTGAAVVKAITKTILSSRKSLRDTKLIQLHRSFRTLFESQISILVHIAKLQLCHFIAHVYPPLESQDFFGPCRWKKLDRALKGDRIAA